MTGPRKNKMPVAPDLVKAGTAALFARAVVIIAGFGSSLLLPLVIDQESVGLYFLTQLLIAGFAIIAQMGLTYSVPATVTAAIAENKVGQARRLSYAALAISSAVGASLGIVLLIAAPYLVVLLEVDHDRAWRIILPFVLAIAPFSALTALIVEVLRALHAIKPAANLAALASVFAALYAGWALLTGKEGSLEGVLSAVLAGSIICVVLGLVLLNKIISGWPTQSSEDVTLRSLIHTTLPNLLTTLILFGLSNLDLIVLARLGRLEDIAQYGLALRFSALILVPLGILNSAAAPLAVQARSTADNVTIENLLARVAIGGAVAAASFYVCFAIVGYAFIATWNGAYQSSYWLTLILGFGNVLHACGGTAGILLMIWGDQRAAFLITLATGLFAAILYIGGFWFGGMFGLAAAAAFANATQVACFVYRVRRRFALDPSLLRRSLSHL
nr:hypothetical protein REQ54_04111 [Rhizobium sp. Q54]